MAQRIYRQEVYGAPNGAAYARIAPLPGLTRGLETHDYALARRTILDQPVRHAVRVRVLSRDGKVLVDVGLGFVIAGTPHPLIAPDGRNLGQITVSIQDVIGFVKLVHRLTGTAVVVRGSLDGHVETSLPAAASATLPAAGPARIGGRMLHGQLVPRGRVRRRAPARLDPRAGRRRAGRGARLRVDDMGTGERLRGHRVDGEHRRRLPAGGRAGCRRGPPGSDQHP